MRRMLGSMFTCAHIAPEAGPCVSEVTGLLGYWLRMDAKASEEFVRLRVWQLQMGGTHGDSQDWNLARWHGRSASRCLFPLFDDHTETARLGLAPVGPGTQAHAGRAPVLEGEGGTGCCQCCDESVLHASVCGLRT